MQEPIEPPDLGLVSEESMVGGRHHRYFRRAASSSDFSDSESGRSKAAARRGRCLADPGLSSRRETDYPRMRQILDPLERLASTGRCLNGVCGSHRLFRTRHWGLDRRPDDLGAAAHQDRLEGLGEQHVAEANVALCAQGGGRGSELVGALEPRPRPGCRPDSLESFNRSLTTESLMGTHVDM